MTGQPPEQGDQGWQPGAPEPSPFGPDGTSSEPGHGQPGFDQPAFDQGELDQGPPGAWSGGQQAYHQAYDQPYDQPYEGYGNPYGPSTNPYQYGYRSYPRSSQAVPALILALSGFFCCGLGGIIGAAMGRSELNAIDRGESDPSQRGTAQAAFIVGLVIVGLHAIPLLFWGFSILLAAGSP